eukprot:scaffold1954_cov364-Prasinococcus_capsulatus_cf.AAC.14
MERLGLTCCLAHRLPSRRLEGARIPEHDSGTRGALVLIVSERAEGDGSLPDAVGARMRH